ncbi:MAG: hypothetical protein UT55_C0005G0025 [Candidatus Peregrinibacteria bacterium GW2011_GWE2_39_6]|nr:MAG: hypothetical protein UT36_C0011G0007 [Candidatus Peregrinibacteria bacterium GW2011_GWF2_39_17]KKR26612.1 MAG: hypothetical protein UT55_C0005G0025 [Candidatus Peregrinibacteria bacterium GW2011_GWE2_39_6]HCW32485.1 DNA helicase UvrD [Candidatus Peregrinibacteria bacterium]
MRFIADFHVHSHYSRATSKEMNIVSLTKWGQLKGIQLIGTGDFTHPRWFEELQEKLEPAEPGFFKLKPTYEQEIQAQVPESCRHSMRFILTSEISSIYKKNDRVRKVHNLIFAPSFQVVAHLNAELQKIGNLKADGRPILGLDSKKLLQIMLNISEKCLFVPAHAWTPHFSIFGSESGFDSLKEAFDELTPYIYALETGLSSDPKMNWRLSELDHLALISNSDAHSPAKLGREANIFETEFSYPAVIKALKTNNPKSFLETIEFFPEEGKYHLDGHRDCQMRMTPEETKGHNFICPKCHKKVTVGVLHRVEKLADRKINFIPENIRPFQSIIPLIEIIAENEQVGTSSKKVQKIYYDLLNNLGNEFSILLHVSLKNIKTHSSPLLAEAIDRIRQGKVHIAGGYDGEFGTIKIFTEKERQKIIGKQRHLF